MRASGHKKRAVLLFLLIALALSLTVPLTACGAAASGNGGASGLSAGQWASAVLAAVAAVSAAAAAMLSLKLRAERKANERRRAAEEDLRRELRENEQLQSAMEMAYRDPLTGVKSKLAYSEAVERMDLRIGEGTVSGFGVVVFDLNDLKAINDSRGHEAGDEYIKDACRLICACFKHSPVFRIGGDEFAAILEGEDYANQDELLERFEKQILTNLDRGRTVVAFGCARYLPQQDKSIRAVFERADAEMYREKALLKSLGKMSRDGADRTEAAEPLFEEVPDLNPRRSILIADDIESSREMLGEFLKEDYDILYTADGLETMELLHSRRDEIALVLLDLYMPNMTGREVIARMQVDEELMSIPVIFISVDENAELDCLKLGAMDFIPKPYPSIEIIKARIARCIELAENRDLIRRTQRDKLTGLFNVDYFLRYVSRFDRHDKDSSFDALACCVDSFYSVRERYGQQFGDLVLRSIGISMKNLARKTGGIACRKEGDVFLLYCPHRDDYEQLLRKLLEDVFIEEETASRVRLKFGVFLNARQEPDVEERFVRARKAAESVNGPEQLYGCYAYPLL